MTTATAETMIRDGRREDLDGVVDVIQAMVDVVACPQLGPMITRDQIQRRVEGYLNKGFPLLIAERDGIVVGVLAYSVYRHLISDERSGAEIAIAVRPGEARTRATLIEGFEHTLRRLGVSTSEVSAWDESMATHLQTAGYTCVSRQFRKDLTCQE